MVPVDQIFTLTLFECGSVQTKTASINLTFCKFFNRFRHRAINSRDSREHITQVVGGFKYLKMEIGIQMRGPF